MNNPQSQSRSARSGKNKSKKGKPRSGSGGRKGRNRYKKRSSSAKPRFKGPEAAYMKYLNLLEQHLASRRKYYELFHRADPKQREKLEKKFSNTCAQLREFEQKLKPHEREYIANILGKNQDDLTYSSNHELQPVGEEVSESGTFEDPHYLESQKQSDFSEDTEESVGTIEDYKRIKGLE